MIFPAEVKLRSICTIQETENTIFGESIQFDKIEKER